MIGLTPFFVISGIGIALVVMSTIMVDRAFQKEMEQFENTMKAIDKGAKELNQTYVELKINQNFDKENGKNETNH